MSSSSARETAREAASKTAKTSCEQLRQDAILCKASRDVHGQGGKTADYDVDCAELFMQYRLCMRDWQAAEREKTRIAQGSNFGMR
jgi:hypothetical protein